jgi:hypothetical protein
MCIRIQRVNAFGLLSATLAHSLRLYVCSRLHVTVVTISGRFHFPNTNTNTSVLAKVQPLLRCLQTVKFSERYRTERPNGLL